MFCPFFEDAKASVNSTIKFFWIKKFNEMFVKHNGWKPLSRLKESPSSNWDYTTETKLSEPDLVPSLATNFF